MDSIGYTNIMEGLKDIHDRSRSMGDEILKLAELSQDVDIKAIVTDLSKSAYSLAIDCKDAAETYEEITSETEEEYVDEVQPEVEEDLEVEVPEDLEILTDEQLTDSEEEEELETNI